MIQTLVSVDDLRCAECTCKVWGFHSGVSEDSGLLGCDDVSWGKWIPTFRKNHRPSNGRQLLAQGQSVTSLKTYLGFGESDSVSTPAFKGHILPVWDDRYDNSHWAGYSEKFLTLCHYVHHKYYADCPGIELRTVLKNHLCYDVAQSMSRHYTSHRQQSSHNSGWLSVLCNP